MCSSIVRGRREEFASLSPQNCLLKIIQGSRTSCRWSNAQVVGSPSLKRFKFLRELPSLSLILSSEQALMEHFHQIKVGWLELDSLAPKLVTNKLFLFLDVLGPVGDLLKNDLHHVHLTNSETSHLGQCFLLHIFMSRCLELLKLFLDFFYGLVILLPACNNLTNVPRIKGKHWIGLEMELICGANDPVFRRLWSRKEVLTVLVCFFNGTGFRLGDVSDKFSRVMTQLFI